MSKSGVKTLEAFFRTFPAFAYNSKRPAEQEFCRLWDSQGWQGSSTKFMTIRKQFLQALVRETNSPVHRFFVDGYEKFDYDSGASPREQFEQLRRFKGWDTSSPAHTKAKLRFEKLFKAEFNSEVDKFFRKYERFDYDPRSSPKLEFRRLQYRMRWGRKNRSPKEIEVYEEARDDFFGAFIDEFDTHIGTDERDIRTWESLCKALGVDFEPAPTSIGQCKRVSLSSITFH